ncbi:uncharacterized protein YukE [Saccharothrix coeruleofusca]|uniref:WXG100 family type VII secretion target n=1 Tax=Saccharothrix coeruleofusca TaxID=33919 RepID=UPI001AE83B11|nr:hypothetical protein [Saccharothrix coeruleofusca]MBP2339026.1 uncharacterized protein YukE [Saccharothrix coeruleofusca]
MSGDGFWTGFAEQKAGEEPPGWTDPDNFAGGGVTESVAQVIDSSDRMIEEGDYAEFGMNAAAMLLDGFGVAVDPLGALATAGIGWLIEHVSFLREPLDWLAGNGDKIEHAVGTWNEVATSLDQIAQQQHDAVKAQAASWEQQAAEAFRASQGQLAQEIAAMSKVCVSVAEQVATAGTITAAIRGMIRDLIAMFVWEVIRNAVIALASSVVSLGTSMAAFAAWAVGRGAVVLGRITQQLAKLLRAIMKILSKLKGLFGKVGDMLKGLARFGRGGAAAGGTTSTAAARAVDAPGAPRFQGLENAGKRVEDWGNARPSLGDVGTKFRETGRDLAGAPGRYRNAGDTWNRATENIGGGPQSMRNATDAYAPFKPLERGQHVSPHSVPDVMGGGFQVKMGADVLRETSKQDELEMQGVKKEQQRAFKRQTGYLDE